MKQYKVLFSDLDGTLIETLSGETFPRGIWDMKFKFDVLDAIKKLAPEDVCIVSNQKGGRKCFGIVSKISYILNCIRYYCGIKGVLTYRTEDPDDEYANHCLPNTFMLEQIWACNLRGLIKDSNGVQYDLKRVKQVMLMIGNSDVDKKTAESFGIDYMDVNEFVKQWQE